MSPVAVRAEGLSKKYRLNARRQSYHTLRDHIASRFWSLVGRRPADQSEIHEEFWALRDACFEIEQGDIAGFVGRNGAGKSTLLKILARITQPTEGRVEIFGRVGSLLEVGTGFHPELTGRENVYFSGAVLGMSKQEIDRNFDEIVAFAEVDRFVDTPVKRYSSGMYVRLAFAVAAHLQSEVLIVDEVLAVGDAAFQKKCLEKMESVARDGRTVLFVSHNAEAVRRLCKRALLLDGGRVIGIGTPDEILARYSHVDMPSSVTTGWPTHVLFRPLSTNAAGPFEIAEIEMLDADGRPKSAVRTWDAVTFRIHYSAAEPMHGAAVNLLFALPNGSIALNLSSSPEYGVPLPPAAGAYTVECHVPQLALAAGSYMVTAGLSIPHVRWLSRYENAAQLSVQPADVFGSGCPPMLASAVLAIPCRWRCRPVATGPNDEHCDGNVASRSMAPTQ